jgi:hypothetical protein
MADAKQVPAAAPSTLQQKRLMAVKVDDKIIALASLLKALTFFSINLMAVSSLRFWESRGCSVLPSGPLRCPEELWPILSP